AGRLTTRVASEVEKKVSAEDVLRKVQEKQRIVESQIAAVDAHYGSELELKRTVAEKTLRQLLKVERCHFENLGAYQHLPQPLVRTLGAVQAGTRCAAELDCSTVSSNKISLLPVIVNNKKTVKQATNSQRENW
ncbi:unnamed protein product, partial [Polarella glacialis]